MIDVEFELNEVRREVAERELAEGRANVMRLSRSYPTSVSDLWDACTTRERLARWFVPVAGELRLHGTYQLEGNAGGRVLSCDPPTSFTATWEYGESVSWIDVRFEEVGPQQARLVLEHIAHPDDHWAEFGPAATGLGWEYGLLGLRLYLDGVEWAQSDSEAWSASADGARFARLAGQDWAQAHEAAGVPRAEAVAAAERTVAFYTADPEAPAGS